MSLTRSLRPSDTWARGLMGHMYTNGWSSMPHSHSIDRIGISRRGFVTLSIAGAGVTAAAMATPEAAYADEPALAPVVADYPNQIKIAHLSDTHFFSRRLYSDLSLIHI